MSISKLTAAVTLSLFSATFALSATLPAQQADTLLLDDGSLYMGEIADSLFNGYGTCIYTDGTVYSGYWKDGLYHGPGTLVYPDGDIYKGDFKNHIKEGKGTYIYNTGARYDGDWKEDRFNGRGTLHFEDGGVYIGEFKDDLKHGYGQLISSDGRSHTGYFYFDDYLGRPSDTYIDPDSTLTDELKEWGFKIEPEHPQMDLSFAFSYSYSGLGVCTMWFDYKKNVFWGISVGMNVTPPTKGTKSGIGWLLYSDDVHITGTYPSFCYLADFGFKVNRISLGGAMGMSLEKRYQNCRANGPKERYDCTDVIYGQAYYKVSVSENDLFMWRCYSRYLFNLTKKTKAYLYLGYGNVDKFFAGMGITI